MKLIIAGGRGYEFTASDFSRLEQLRSTVTEVVSGGAPGADRCGETWAQASQIPVKRFPADWKTHGRAAGPIRNAQMAAYADAVALFPGGKGTQSMYNEAMKAGLQVFDFRRDEPEVATQPAPVTAQGGLHA